MSEQENIGVVQKLFKAITEGDAAGASQLLTDDVVLISPGPEDLLPWAGEYHGPNGLLQYYTTLSQGVELIGMQGSETIAQGDKVVLLGQHSARVRATGKTYDLKWAQVYTLREGKVSAMYSYHDSYVVAEAVRSD